jgi:hypothetical protein
MTRRPSIYVPLAWLLALVPGLSGCEVLVDVDEPQCRSDDQCSDLLGPGYTCNGDGVCAKPVSTLPAQWQCITQTPPSIVPKAEEITATMLVVDLGKFTVPAGLTGDVCESGDIGCMDPITVGIKPNASGYMDMTVPHAFDGYFVFRSPEHVPGFSVTNKPYTETRAENGLSLVTPAKRMSLVSGSGIATEAERGIAIIETVDCDNKPGERIVLSAKTRDENDELVDATPFYFDGGLPSRTVGSTRLSPGLSAAGEKRAVGGFSNLAQGYVEFTAKLETGEFVASKTTQIRDGWITYLLLHAGYR